MTDVLMRIGDEDPEQHREERPGENMRRLAISRAKRPQKKPTLLKS